MRHTLRLTALAVLAGAVFATPHAGAVIPYTPVPDFGPPVVGGGVLAPFEVYGKEHSHDRDFSVVGPTPDPQQVIAWDGSGGTADTVDFTDTRPDWREDQQVDAIANRRDSLYRQLRRDTAHLVFTHDDVIAGYGGSSGGPSLQPIPSGGPILLSNGNAIGGAGEVSIELAGAFAPPDTQFEWAKQPEVNGMPLPSDVDGLELWGPEPRETDDIDMPVRGDTNKYSLDVDFLSGVSVWNGSGTPYVDWPTITTAVESLLGPIPSSAFSLRDDTQGRQAINLDALMVNDTVGRPDVFDFEFDRPSGEPILDQNDQELEPFDQMGDSLIFSIRQIVDPADSDGYYATGSELFVLDSFGLSFLDHGGHVWDHAYGLSSLVPVEYEGQETEFAVLDINGIEAIGEALEKPPEFCPGDFDGDGQVDNNDLNLLLANWGAAVPPAPAGWGGFLPTGPAVDNDELNLLLANWGKGVVSPVLVNSSAVPEPSALLLAAVATCGMLRRRG